MLLFYFLNKFLKLLTMLGSFEVFCVASEAVFSFLFVQMLLILSKMLVSSSDIRCLLSWFFFSMNSVLREMVVDGGNVLVCLSLWLWVWSISDEWSVWSKLSEWEHAISYSVFGFFVRFGSAFSVTKRALRTKWPFPSRIILSSHVVSCFLERSLKFNNSNSYLGKINSKLLISIS